MLNDTLFSFHVTYCKKIKDVSKYKKKLNCYVKQFFLFNVKFQVVIG